MNDSKDQNMELEKRHQTLMNQKSTLQAEFNSLERDNNVNLQEIKNFDLLINEKDFKLEESSEMSESLKEELRRQTQVIHELRDIKEDLETGLQQTLERLNSSETLIINLNSTMDELG